MQWYNKHVQNFVAKGCYVQASRAFKHGSASHSLREAGNGTVPHLPHWDSEWLWYTLWISLVIKHGKLSKLNGSFPASRVSLSRVLGADWSSSRCGWFVTDFAMWKKHPAQQVAHALRETHGNLESHQEIPETAGLTCLHRSSPLCSGWSGLKVELQWNTQHFHTFTVYLCHWKV